MAHGYATANALSALGPTAFTWSTGGTTDRAFLNDGRMDKVHSSGGSSTSVELTIDLGAATALVGFAVLNHSMASWTLPTLAIHGADDAGFTTGVVAAKTGSFIVKTAPNQKDTALQFPSVTKRYWRLYFQDSSARTLTLGEVYGLASVTSLTRLKVYGHGEGEEYRLNSTESRTGERRDTFLSGPLRRKALPFSDLRATERDEVMAMWRATRGGATPLLWLESVESTAIAATAAAQECLWGKLSPTFDWVERDYNLFDVTALELRSLGREVGA